MAETVLELYRHTCGASSMSGQVCGSRQRTVLEGLRKICLCGEEVSVKQECVSSGRRDAL
jgi:hypothetical protein